MKYFLFSMGLMIASICNQANAAFSGFVTLTDGDSYDFASATFGTYSGGDLYYRSMDSGSSSANDFLANNLNQRGLIDLGVVENPLDELVAPDTGYSRFGVEAILGHTYVSLINDSDPFTGTAQESNFIFFTVTDWTTSAIGIDFYYGPSAVPVPAAFWLLLSGLFVVYTKTRGKYQSISPANLR